jgi:hypothetical protein
VLFNCTFRLAGMSPVMEKCETDDSETGIKKAKNDEETSSKLTNTILKLEEVDKNIYR